MFLQILSVVILLSYASVIHVHTYKIVALIGCIDLGGALFDFLEKCAKWHL
jgi:hypothetical protein